MTDLQSNELSMSKAVQEILRENITIVQSVPAFEATKNELDNTLNAIHEAAQVQARKITGSTEDKESSAMKVIDAIIAITGPVKSYAKATGNNTLYRAISYSRSDFRRTRHTAAIDAFTVIRDLIEANATALEVYGISESQINDLTGLINEYSNSVTAPRKAIAAKSVATKSLIVSFKELKSLIQQLDGFVEAKKKDNLDFYNAYKSARVIMNNRGKRKQAESSSEDAAKKAA